MLEKIENQSNAAKEAAKEAWVNRDLPGLLKAGFDNFIHIILDRTLSFNTFLNCTSKYFDHFILETEKNEKLFFVGGKMTVQLKTEKEMLLSADFYFQTDEKRWIQKHKEGKLDARKIKDWDSDLNLKKLREELALEFPVDRPDEDLNR